MKNKYTLLTLAFTGNLQQQAEIKQYNNVAYSAQIGMVCYIVLYRAVRKFNVLKISMLVTLMPEIVVFIN